MDVGVIEQDSSSIEKIVDGLTLFDDDLILNP